MSVEQSSRGKPPAQVVAVAKPCLLTDFSTTRQERINKHLEKPIQQPSQALNLVTSSRESGQVSSAMITPSAPISSLQPTPVQYNAYRQ